MSTTRLFSLFGASNFIRDRITYTSSVIIYRIRFKKLFPSHTLRFHRYCSSSTAICDKDTATLNEDSTEASIHSHHPWPEWVSFVDRLKAKSYILDSAPPANDEGGDIGDGNNTTKSGVIYEDMNLLKDACLRFARDRYDIFESLSRQDIQTVVERGCPNLWRKVVNSAKRLRLYVQLDEGDVCSACTLRGSCDRAYVILKEPEAVSRTVDVVRILMFFALDSLVTSGGEKPPGRDLVEASARKLISELNELSDKMPVPEIQKAPAKTTQRKQKNMDFADDELSRNVEMKRGDWMCPKCNFMNFARNLRCLKCKEDGPKRVGGDDIELKKGDWICPECNFMNFTRNIRCLKCKTEGPKRFSTDIEMKKGDWNCVQCGFMNFASNSKCLRCRELRPKRQLNPGEWECLSCGFLNFKGNKVCRKCDAESPKGRETEYDDQVWKRPF